MLSNIIILTITKLSMAVFRYQNRSIIDPEHTDHQQTSHNYKIINNQYKNHLYKHP